MLNFFLRLFKKKRRVAQRSTYFEEEYHNLQAIVDLLNAQYFDNKASVEIAWFGNQNRSFKRRIVFGSYNHQKKRIKIHRFLNRKEVPDYFVSFIVYHEMLHQLFPPIKRIARERNIHHRDFVQAEKKFHAYALAKEFQRRLRKELFRS